MYIANVGAYKYALGLQIYENEKLANKPDKCLLMKNVLKWLVC
ncbi:hypothetical protein M23134_04819 [Microscilla marina ATCC 23134]|uniref:Uncharacterized protein n=1 Tax=Microscilla marina ATCC 23134 TaxID=313606 RepID=A1ZRY1_MICM2|nr:hypothetical protein M23134_04819 [Microscilla marina ATCC 23134]